MSDKKTIHAYLGVPEADFNITVTQLDDEPLSNDEEIADRNSHIFRLEAEIEEQRQMLEGKGMSRQTPNAYTHPSNQKFGIGDKVTISTASFSTCDTTGEWWVQGTYRQLHRSTRQFAPSTDDLEDYSLLRVDRKNSIAWVRESDITLVETPE